ncbi:hypothetical protein MKZ38_005573 [Zalerion maritima]|uniref:Uncharacterized protein n=1 Tax=Zalerion maritima TaxID=339359 RepID=A0AAD5RKI4_9PEZI|nr:hypothetical protein MKZ38_005573 [Zalerion maritima]
MLPARWEKSLHGGDNASPIPAASPYGVVVVVVAAEAVLSAYPRQSEATPVDSAVPQDATVLTRRPASEPSDEHPRGMDGTGSEDIETHNPIWQNAQYDFGSSVDNNNIFGPPVRCRTTAEKPVFPGDAPQISPCASASVLCSSGQAEAVTNA